MGSNLVIVAIPDENDRVWKVSSEKVPHLTVLWLGDSDNVANLEQIVKFVEHAASRSLCRFHLPVDRRGELGDDNADVLFFKKGRHDYRAIRDFRNALLQDNNIKTAYDSTSQFDGPWQPHLTLGYPTSPAKPEENKGYYDGFYEVCFNKIAVWVEDSDGPEFLLKDHWDEYDLMEVAPMDVAMSDIRSADEVREALGLKALEHHGVKGQKWGVRKEEVGSGGHIRINPHTNNAAVSLSSQTGVVAAIVAFPIGVGVFLHPGYRKKFAAEWNAAGEHNKLVSGDAKYKRAIDKSKRAVDVHNHAAGEINAKVGAFNSDKRWKNDDGSDINLTQNPAKQKEYDDAVTRELINPAYANAAVKVYGSKSPSGRYKFEINDAATGTLKFRDTLREEQAIHADDDEEVTVEFVIVRDSAGRVLGFKPEEMDSMAQTAEMGAEFILAHYGIKGMRWGVRQHRDVTTKQHIDTGLVRRKTKVEAEGGEAHPASDDAVKAAVQKQKLRKSGTAALSNQELRELQTRLQLETQVELLTSRKGKRFVEKQLEDAGREELKRGLVRGGRAAGPKVLKKAKKAAGTAAAAAVL